MPWKLYGLVRGLNAPPRRMLAPARRTRSATSNSSASPSIAHGPAITARCPPPIFTPLIANDRVLRVELPAGQLERLEDRHHLLDPGDRLQRLDLELVLVADHADDRPRDPLAQVRRQAQGRDPLEHVLDDLRRRMRLQHDDHSGSSGRCSGRSAVESRSGQEPAGARHSAGDDRTTSFMTGKRQVPDRRSHSWNDLPPGMNVPV